MVGKKRQERSGGCIPTPLDDNALNLGSSGLMTLKVSSGRPSLIHGQEVVKEVRVCQSRAGSTTTFAEAVKSRKICVTDHSGVEKGFIEVKSTK